MSQSQIGAQMYTLREHTQTPADIAKTCRRVKQMGYDAIQISGFGKIDNAELGKILKDEGLVCAATHVKLDMMQDVEVCIAYHQAIGCKYTAVGGYFPWNKIPEVNEQSWRDYAKQYSAIAKVLAAKGLRAGYHNHSHELVQYDGKQALAILIDETDPSIWFEIDTYWIAQGGGDPAAWIERVKGRIPAVHVKDMTVDRNRVQKMAEVGAGNLNWPRIIEACKAAGVEWYLVERDDGDLDPFDSLKISLDNLHAMGIA
jgi:sugar phosphate isomerase/epimerase